MYIIYIYIYIFFFFPREIFFKIFLGEEIAQISNYIPTGDLKAKHEIFSEFSCGKTLIISHYIISRS